LRDAAAGCRGCHLHEHATQTVFGEGPRAGRELDRALEAAGIDREQVYVTNVVKHVEFEERGKRRIHQTPRKGEVDACMPWLDTEIELIHPSAIVRRRDAEARDAERQALAADLRAVMEAV
jgi:DNA polymerase